MYYRIILSETNLPILREIPLSTYRDLEGAISFAQLQMTYLDKEYDYYIAKWNLDGSKKIEVIDTRLRLIKTPLTDDYE